MPESRGLATLLDNLLNNISKEDIALAAVPGGLVPKVAAGVVKNAPRVTRGLAKIAEGLGGITGAGRQVNPFKGAAALSGLNITKKVPTELINKVTARTSSGFGKLHEMNKLGDGVDAGVYAKQLIKSERQLEKLKVPGVNTELHAPKGVFSEAKEAAINGIAAGARLTRNTFRDQARRAAKP